MSTFNIPSRTADEAGALGCVLLANSNGPELLNHLNESHFHDLRHLTVFRALVSLEFDSAPLDVPSLVKVLETTGEIENAGGLAYVASLPEQTPSVQNFPTHLGILEEYADRRRMLKEAESLRSRALDLSVSVDAKPRHSLPAIEDAFSFAAQQIAEPPQIIWEVLHRGCKLAIGGGSKTFKTWALLDLCLSVSHGEPWLSFKTSRSRVGYINLELPRWSVHSRLLAIAREKRINLAPGWLHIWNLRGQATSYTELLPILSAELAKHELGLLVVDPIYKLYGSADENSARDISALLNKFEQLAQETGAAIAFASHFSKGNQAGKESVDRISGSGVFARDPDAILTLTRHEQDGAFVVDSTLRNCRTIEPFVVRWQYPLMRRDEELDPTKLKQAKAGRTPTFTVPMIVKVLGKRKLSSADWQKRCADEAGITRATFYRLLADAEKFNLVTKNEKEKWSVSQVSKAPSDTNKTSQSQNPLGSET